MFFDENENCQVEAPEPGLSAWKIKATGSNGTYYGLSDSSGHFVITVTPGAYTVSLLPANTLDFICSNDILVNLPQQGDSLSVSYPVQLYNPECPQLSIDLGVAILRRCFDNGYYHIQYSNYSPVPAPGAYITLQLDNFLDIVEAELPYTGIGNNSYRFDLGTVPPNSNFSFWVRVSVSCDAVLGQIHCSKAHIYPDTLCAPAPSQWSGALLRAASVCTGDSLRLIIQNTGTGPMSGLLEYIVIEDGSLGLHGVAPPLAAGEVMAVTVPANGSTWRIEAEQEPFAPTYVKPVLSVEGCTSTGAFSTGFFMQFPVANGDPWISENCNPNNGSYDPNDKQGFPTGYGSNHYIRPETELEYLIRFQNTGTDTAFTVVIRDTLSPWFDPLSVRPGASSHSYQFTLDGAGILIFDFQNILLPDSNVNEPASHGFVRYRVRPRSDVPLETDILNKAAIYFDFNEPVITNTTQHRVGVDFVTVGWWAPQDPEFAITVTPHPLRDASWISLHEKGQPAPDRPAGTSGDYRLQVFDLMGRPVRTLNAGEPRFLLRKDDLNEGVYVFRIEHGGAWLGSGKLLIR